MDSLRTFLNFRKSVHNDLSNLSNPSPSWIILQITFVRENEDLVQDIVRHAFFFDHVPLVLKFAIDKPEAQKKIIQYRKLKDIDIDAFKTDLYKSRLFQEDTHDVNKLANLFKEKMSNILDKHAPLITKEVYVCPDSPWFTEDLAEMKRVKRKAERKWMKDKSCLNLERWKSL